MTTILGTETRYSLIQFAGGASIVRLHQADTTWGFTSNDFTKSSLFSLWIFEHFEPIRKSNPCVLLFYF